MGHGIIWWMVVGLIAGWAAGRIMKGGGYGVIVDIVLGIVGGIVGGWAISLSILDGRYLPARLHGARTPTGTGVLYAAIVRVGTLVALLLQKLGTRPARASYEGNGVLVGGAGLKISFPHKGRRAALCLWGKLCQSEGLLAFPTGIPVYPIYKTLPMLLVGHPTNPQVYL